jgi:hypothetical protein
MSDNTAAHRKEQQAAEAREKARKEMEKASGLDREAEKNNQERDKRPYNKEADG